MALEITGNIELGNGITLSSIYGRTNYRVNDSSTQVVIVVDYWIDENAYSSGKNPLQPNISVDGRFSYDRTTDGTDVLDFTNITIKSELESQGYSVSIIEL